MNRVHKLVNVFKFSVMSVVAYVNKVYGMENIEHRIEIDHGDSQKHNDANTNEIHNPVNALTTEVSNCGV